MELKNTILLMNSEDFKDRLLTEYLQTKLRYDKLRKMLVKYEAGALEFTPKCSLDLLKRQLSAMDTYLYILEIRAEVEGIELQDKEN